ncbi:MAG: hypothetical protein VB060_07305 [Oscillibacter sp.]|nr:hypothetical protein [Oscillibacter sp.]MEA4993624.1 hypothetical protein [Oscillibacter sp.]
MRGRGDDRRSEELPEQLPVYRMEEAAYATACRKLLAWLEADKAH